MITLATNTYLIESAEQDFVWNPYIQSFIPAFAEAYERSAKAGKVMVTTEDMIFDVLYAETYDLFYRDVMAHITGKSPLNEYTMECLLDEISEILGEKVTERDLYKVDDSAIGEAVSRLSSLEIEEDPGGWGDFFEFSQAACEHFNFSIYDQWNESEIISAQTSLFYDPNEENGFTFHDPETGRVHYMTPGCYAHHGNLSFEESQRMTGEGGYTFFESACRDISVAVSESGTRWIVFR